MLPDLAPCVKCKGENQPKVVRVEGMYYVQCPCCKWDNYQFLGLKPQYAIEEWNKFNRPINRTSYWTRHEMHDTES